MGGVGERVKYDQNHPAGISQKINWEKISLKCPSNQQSNSYLQESKQQDSTRESATIMSKQ